MSLCFKIAEYHPSIAYEHMTELNRKFGFPLEYGVISRPGFYIAIVLYVTLESDDDFAIFLLTHHDTLITLK